MSQEKKLQIIDIEAKFQAWITKIESLKSEIKALENLQNNPIINASSLSIGVFLLKMQIVEFELKQIISTLDGAINRELIKNKFSLTKTIRYPKDLEGLTLGKIINIFCEFEGPVSDALKKDLQKLNKLRNDFTHNLFNQDKNLADMKQEACAGINISNLIIEYIGIMAGDLNKVQVNEVKNDK